MRLRELKPGDQVGIHFGSGERTVEVTGHLSGGVLVRDVDEATMRAINGEGQPYILPGDMVCTVVRRRGVERWVKQQRGVEYDPLKGAA